MKNLIAIVLVLVGCFANDSLYAQTASQKPIRALLIAGGCCHDYANQQRALCEGIQSRANVQVDVYWTDNSTTAPILPIYSRLNWADEYDVIIHDECAADVKDPALINRIVQTHQKIPAVHLHCAMHSFRGGNDVWFKHLGLQSNSHGPQEPIEIHFGSQKHPITETLSDWTTIREELYNNVKIFDAVPLATGKQTIGTGDKARVEEAVVAWVNESQGARSFSTTIGHNTETVQDARYLELVTRGLLWACGKLNVEYLRPYSGENKVTFVDKNKFSSPSGNPLGSMPSDATLVKVTASSTQGENPNPNAVDGKTDTRWCASGPSYPQWLQLEFEQPRRFQSIAIDWESMQGVYQYRVEGSNDAKDWTQLIDKSKNTSGLQEPEAIKSDSSYRFLRINGLGSRNGWCSIREVRVEAEGIKMLWPADPKSEAPKFIPAQQDAYAKSGNTIPRIEKQSAEQEAEILRDVKVPDGFEATVFAAPPAVNYPVFVAATVDGTVYVSSDGNGSLGRNPMRGRVIRLRDTDGDGRADETKIFCEIDAPRGLVWDNDRLYLMHPPHLSAFIDHDKDGVADEQKVLVKNLAFDYDKRPADHTTNGVSMGADGWLYIAGGDFGFMNAEGTDGRRVTHRGGGVIRVRPDGTGLEVFSTGTRNILEVAISPQMDLFARDNTNDGGGWDVRLHHFTGNEDHGYPRLYKNFADECVPPLADYGGGSGCGAVYIDEPGFGPWGNAPFTADWGTGALYRHTVSAKGSTYVESSQPKPFIQMTRPTDADVDGNSRVYCASWRGATFDWNGPDVGYIVCVKPKNFVPEPMPVFAKAADKELIDAMSSSSYRRRIEASRELMRRGNQQYQQLLNTGTAKRNADRNLLDHLQTDATDSERIAALTSQDSLVVHTAIRSLAKHQSAEACFKALDSATLDSRKAILRALSMMHQPTVVEGLIARLKDTRDDEYADQLLGSLCRLHFVEGEWSGDSWGTRPDTRGPYYQPEAWSQTSAIAAVLQRALESATPQRASRLIETMQRNRIQSSDALQRILELAANDANLLPAAVMQLAASNDLPVPSLTTVQRAVELPSANANLLATSATVLARMDSEEAYACLLRALSKLDLISDANADRDRARKAFVNSPKLDLHTTFFDKSAASHESGIALWSEAALVTIASKSNGSPETVAMAKNAIDSAWSSASRRKNLIKAVALIGSHYLDEKILVATSDAEAEVAELAKSAVKQLKIKPRAADNTPKLANMSTGDAAKEGTTLRGDVSVGAQIFSKAKCVSCHTVKQDEIQKGPYLGNIAKTYKRTELAIAILEPSKTIAQGFITNLILTSDETVVSGFITNEQPDRISIRDSLGNETTILKEDIEERKTSTVSSMPANVMNEFTLYEFASLLDYLESLSAAPSNTKQ